MPTVEGDQTIRSGILKYKQGEPRAWGKHICVVHLWPIQEVTESIRQNSMAVLLQLQDVTHTAKVGHTFCPYLIPGNIPKDSPVTNLHGLVCASQECSAQI